MPTKQLTFVVTAFALLSHPAPTQAVETRGARSCGAWVQQSKNGGMAAIASQAWLVGFLSGLAFESDVDFLEGTDNESLYLWVTNYCQANPLSSLVAAGEALSIELKKKRGFAK